MGMSYIDTDRLEQMRDEMFRILSRVEESEGTLRQMHSQMLTEDLGLSFYPQWEEAVEDCGRLLAGTERLREMADRFLTVLEEAPENYGQLERRHVQSIQRMQGRMSVLQAGLSGVMRQTYPLGLEVRRYAAMEPERQPGEEMPLEMANLTAVTQVLKAEYGYSQVQPGIPGIEPLPGLREPDGALGRGRKEAAEKDRRQDA